MIILEFTEQFLTESSFRYDFKLKRKEEGLILGINKVICNLIFGLEDTTRKTY